MVDISESDQNSDVNLLTAKDPPLQNNTLPDNTSEALAAFLAYPGVWLVSMFFILGSVPFGLYDVSLSPYLLQTFGVDGDTAGLYFLAMGALYAICTQFVGLLVDKGTLFFFSICQVSKRSV